MQDHISEKKEEIIEAVKPRKISNRRVVKKPDDPDELKRVSLGNEDKKDNDEIIGPPKRKKSRNIVLESCVESDEDEHIVNKENNRQTELSKSILTNSVNAILKSHSNKSTAVAPIKETESALVVFKNITDSFVNSNSVLKAMSINSIQNTKVGNSSDDSDTDFNNWAINLKTTSDKPISVPFSEKIVNESTFNKKSVSAKLSAKLMQNEPKTLFINQTQKFEASTSAKESPSTTNISILKTKEVILYFK